MKNKLKIGLGLVLLLVALTPIQFSNADGNTVKVNRVNQDGLDVYDFTDSIYDETDINEDGLIKIGEGYTSDGVFYEAFKPAVE